MIGQKLIIKGTGMGNTRFPKNRTIMCVAIQMLDVFNFSG